MAIAITTVIIIGTVTIFTTTRSNNEVCDVKVIVMILNIVRGTYGATRSATLLELFLFLFALSLIPELQPLVYEDSLHYDQHHRHHSRYNNQYNTATSRSSRSSRSSKSHDSRAGYSSHYHYRNHYRYQHLRYGIGPGRW